MEIVEILETNGITDGFSCCDEDLPCDSHQLHIVGEEGDEDDGDNDNDDGSSPEAILCKCRLKPKDLPSTK